MGRAELLRVLPTKTEFWYTYEEFAREELEAQTGKSVVSPLSAKRFFKAQDPTLNLPEESDKDEK